MTTIRLSRSCDLPAVNDLRRMVHRLHADGRPDIFQPEFGKEMENRLYEIYAADPERVIVAETDGMISGFACVEYIEKPASPYSLARRFYRVEEFGVSPDFRRKGVASALVAFMKDDARKKGFQKIELDMWTFNETALAFYEAAGFETYRRYMELML